MLYKNWLLLQVIYSIWRQSCWERRWYRGLGNERELLYMMVELFIMVRNAKQFVYSLQGPSMIIIKGGLFFKKQRHSSPWAVSGGAAQPYHLIFCQT